MEEQIVQMWSIHARIQLFFLNALTPEQLAVTATSKGKSVADQFGHMHNVRLMWLKASAPDLLEGLEKLEKASTLEAGVLAIAMQASAAAIETLVRRSAASGGKVKCFKPDVVSFVGYLISHESFHAGKADMSLRLAGLPVDDKTHYGMWEWGVR